MTSVIYRVLALTENQGGIASRRQLYALGVTRSELRAHLRARRWRKVTGQTIAVHNGVIGQRGRMWQQCSRVARAPSSTGRLRW